jgi:hypothetical protein
MGPDRELWYSDEDEEQCDRFWADFSDKAGLHLSWMQTARGASRISMREGRVLAQVQGVTLFPRSMESRPARRVTVDGTTYSITRRRYKPTARAPDGTTVISFTGWHFNGDSRAVAHLSNGRFFRFPVRGTSHTNAVMSAVDGDWRPVFSLRQVQGTAHHDNAVEIVVEPTEEPTLELLLAMAVGYHNLYRFFRTQRVRAEGGAA